MRNAIIKVIAVLILLVTFSVSAQWNNPHPVAANNNTRYGSFAGPPKTLDPAKAYSSNELQFIAQIYEPLLQYHYLKRPYTLEPLAAAAMPQVLYYDSKWQQLPATTRADKVAYSVYDIHIKKGIFFEQSPAFTKTKDGSYRYHHLTTKHLQRIDSLASFSD